MKKGNRVKINVAAATAERALKRRRGTLVLEESYCVNAYYLLTEEDERRWYESKRIESDKILAEGGDPSGVNFDATGEPRLAPLSRRVEIIPGFTYRVIKARCRAQLNWGGLTSGLMEIFDPASNRPVYIRRDCMEIADAA